MSVEILIGLRGASSIRTRSAAACGHEYSVKPKPAHGWRNAARRPGHEKSLFPANREEASLPSSGNVCQAPQSGPASVKKVPLLENQPLTPSDCPPKNHEKNTSS